MTFRTGYRAAARSATLLAVAFSATACLGPTYGTDKTATEQLVDDIGNIASIRPKDGPEIAYSPRPGIVRPPETATLPPPQQPVSQNNPNWVEAPEQTRERLVAEATENQNEPGYRSPLARVGSSSGGRRPRLGPSPSAQDGSPSPSAVLQAETQRTRFQENLKIQRGAYSDRRRFLSDPPLEYRRPAESAPVGDVGESERKKEQERLAAARREQKTNWFKWPW